MDIIREYNGDSTDTDTDPAENQVDLRQHDLNNSIVPASKNKTEINCRRRKKTFFTRQKNHRKQSDNKIKPHEKLETGKDTNFPDMSKSLPFTHCKIVLSLEDDIESARHGWAKEGDGFVFYDSITSREKAEMTEYLWEPWSPKQCSRSLNSLTRVVENQSAIDSAKSGATLLRADVATKLDNCFNDEGVMTKTKSNSAKRIYKCPYCLLPFPEAGDLIKHLPLHRGNAEDGNEYQHSNRTSSRLRESFRHKQCELQIRDAASNGDARRRAIGEVGTLESNTGVVERSGPLIHNTEASNSIGIGENIMMIQRSDTPQWSCLLCAKVFSFRPSVVRHIRAVHRKEKNVNCPRCPKSFFDNDILRAHLIVHSGLKNFTCSVCSKSFSRQDYIRVHMRFHSGLKGHKCFICLKTFYTSSHLKQHHMRVHEVKKRYGCTACPKEFSERFLLKRHMKVHGVTDLST